MNLSRRELGGSILAAGVGLSGCLEATERSVEPVEELPPYITDLYMENRELTVEINQLEMSEQLEYFVLSSERSGQLNAREIHSGTAKHSISMSTDWVDGDLFRLVFLEGGEIDCYYGNCSHSGGRLEQTVAFRYSEE